MSSNGADVVGTVGSLLAIIANSIQDVLRTLMFADKQAWRSPEFEQLRLLEETLDEAKRDFQELPALINGRLYYESDRNVDNLVELRELCNRFEELSHNIKSWVRAGGPVETEWAVQTRWLKRELHRAQCRAVRRIHDDLKGSSTRPRCLGALIVWQSQQRHQPKQHTQRGTSPATAAPTPIPTITSQPDSTLSGEITACNSTGTFQRLGPGNQDIAFVCDFCDGFLVWEDLRSMPSTRQAVSTSQASMAENWAATGFRHPQSQFGPSTYPPGAGDDSDIELEEEVTHPAFSAHTGKQALRITTATVPSATVGTGARRHGADAEAAIELRGEEKTVVFPAVAIANHLAPEPGDWQAPLLCPLCDEYYYEEQGDDDMDRVRFNQDERGFESVAQLQEHLEWSHAALIPGLTNVVAAPTDKSACEIM